MRVPPGVLQAVRPHFVAEHHPRGGGKPRKRRNEHFFNHLCRGNRRHRQNAHSPVNQSVHGNADAPNGFVENNRQRDFEKFADESPIKCEELPQFCSTRAFGDVNIGQNRNALKQPCHKRADCRAAKPQLRKTEFSVNERVVNRGVDADGAAGNHNGKRYAVHCTVKIGVALGNRLKRIRNCDDGQITRAQSYRALFGRENTHNAVGRENAGNGKNQRRADADAKRKPQHPPDVL